MTEKLYYNHLENSRQINAHILDSEYILTNNAKAEVTLQNGKNALLPELHIKSWQNVLEATGKLVATHSKAAQAKMDFANKIYEDGIKVKNRDENL